MNEAFKGQLDSEKIESKRKIIQINSSSNYLYVLCNDGSVWMLNYAKWERINDIPQD